MSFNSYEFTWGGESSYQYGLMIYDFNGTKQNNVSFGNQASIVETRINNRIQPLHFGVNYHSKPLEFDLIFGSEEPLDRFELSNISMWLTGNQQYQWLSIDQPDLDNVQFRCIITKLTPLAHGWLPVAFEATVMCDCPYAYGHSFEKQYSINGETSILFRNDSSVREYIKPHLSFRPLSGSSELRIINKDDGDREFLLSGIPTATTSIDIDNLNGIIQESPTQKNLYSGFNMNFFRLVQGDNNLVISGTGTLTISGRFLYNVAA